MRPLLITSICIVSIGLFRISLAAASTPIVKTQQHQEITQTAALVLSDLRQDLSHSGLASTLIDLEVIGRIFTHNARLALRQASAGEDANWVRMGGIYTPAGAPHGRKSGVKLWIGQPNRSSAKDIGIVHTVIDRQANLRHIAKFLVRPDHGSLTVSVGHRGLRSDKAFQDVSKTQHLALDEEANGKTRFLKIHRDGARNTGNFSWTLQTGNQGTDGVPLAEVDAAHFIKTYRKNKTPPLPITSSHTTRQRLDSLANAIRTHSQTLRLKK